MVALTLRNYFQKLLPNIRKDPARALLVEPLNFFWTTKKNSAQDQFAHPIRMSLSISERQRAAPGTSKDLPVFNAEMLAQFLDVCYEIPGRILFQTRMRSALAGAALIEKNNSIEFRVEVATVVGLDSATRSTMKKYRGFAIRVTHLLVVKLVNRRNLQPARVEWFDLIIESS